MSWEDVLKVRRRPKKKLPPSNPFAGESKRHEETVEGKLEAKEAEEAVRQAKLDEERKLVRRGRIRFNRLEEIEEGHKIPDKTDPITGKAKKPRGLMGVLGKNRCTMCGTRIRPTGAKKLSRGKDDPNKNLGYCERCAGLLAGTLSSKDFKGIDIAAFQANRGKRQGSRKHWHKDKRNKP